MFDYNTALKENSEDDVLNYLTSTRNFDVQGALKNGNSKQDIIKYLASTGVDKKTSLGVAEEVKPLEAKSETTQPFTLFPATGKEGYLSQAVKTLGNLPGSVLSFGKSIVEAPKNIATSFWDIQDKLPQEFVSLVKESNGDISKAIERTVAEMHRVAYEGFVPQFLRSIIGGDYEKAQKAIAEDPVGQIMPLIIGVKIIADKAGVGAQFNKSMEMIAKPITAPASAIGSAMQKVISSVTKFGVSPATSLNPETISTAFNSPQELGKAIEGGLNRRVVGEQVKQAISARIDDLSDMGQGYSAIRGSEGEAKMTAGWIGNTLKENGWADKAIAVDKYGTARPAIKPTKLAIISMGEQNAIQKFMDVWGTKENITASEFLDGRAFLDKWAKWSTEATSEGQALFRHLRHDFNKIGTKQIEGLNQLDITYGGEKILLNQLKKDFIAKNSSGVVQLSDNAINKIANATGTGRDLILSRLENLIPGITEQIKLVKVMEDIDYAMGQKVGAYGRAVVAGGGVVMLNPALVIGSIIASPGIAVPLLRGLGLTVTKIKGILDVIGIPFQELNKLPGKVNFSPK